MLYVTADCSLSLLQPLKERYIFTFLILLLNKIRPNRQRKREREDEGIEGYTDMDKQRKWVGVLLTGIKTIVPVLMCPTDVTAINSHNQHHADLVPPPQQKVKGKVLFNENEFNSRSQTGTECTGMAIWTPVISGKQVILTAVISGKTGDIIFCNIRENEVCPKQCPHCVPETLYFSVWHLNIAG